MLAFNGVGHRFAARTIFNDVSLAIAEPRVVLSGANGIGKTTLLLIAGGLLRPANGEVTLNGNNVLDSAARPLIGMSASKVALPGFMSASDLLQFHQRLYGCAAPEYWITAFGLSDYLPTLVQDLSLGNYKKLSLILALMHQPELLLLDEPANGLDAKTREALYQCLAEYPGQIVIASHEPLNFAGHTVRQLHLDHNGVHER
ncbi:ABC transporter ATP-binding protein [Alteromonas gilva]|uniref:ABC transporter ATP-binding protein n=1 Tax=Alteromonas gilva TaxID=2987522 RepID=A0ABT5L3Z0_9ALTE|nr:ABC transporter ATP-binding protein [Alteromonas gilva]MDC8831749.1 ABC transporter ATP-binding protein [Alteromonas gilva]